MRLLPYGIPRVDLRKAPRWPMHYPALISREDGSPHIKCLVWQMTGIGARLTVGMQDQIPDQFVLMPAKDERGRRWCQALWRTQMIIGVRFLAGPPNPSPGRIKLDC
jgi:hypothetical protein